MSHMNPSRGLTLVEAMMAMLVVSVLLVAAMRGVATAGLTQFKNAESLWAAQAADSLLNEILAADYQDPEQTPSFGPEAGESTRATFDDVDDYHGYTQVFTQPMGLCKVTVSNVNPANPSVISASATGVKKITVAVVLRGRTTCQRMALRSDAP